jgi:16S rRNA C1402 (ribose-2'-O) methylase RsmI
VRAWAGGAPTVDDPGQQLIQYAFAEPGHTLVPLSIDAASPGLQAGTVSLVTVVPGAKRSVLVYSVVNP